MLRSNLPLLDFIEFYSVKLKISRLCVKIEFALY